MKKFMKAVTFDKFGSSDQLKIQDVPLREVKSGEVLVKIHYTSVNPVDWKIREGYLKDFLPHQFPIVSGWDASGEVVEVASDVKSWSVGTKVMAYTRLPKVHAGTYAQYICLPHEYLAKVPTNVSLEQAAAIPLVGLTAYQALHRVANLKNGENVLITAGAGGVGSLAIQIAKAAGAVVTATAQSANHSYLKELGADHCVDYTKPTIVDDLKRISPNGFQVVFDCAGGDSLQQAWQVVARNGRLVSIVDTPDPQKSGRADVQANYHFVEPIGEELEALSDLLQSKKLVPPSIEVKSVRDAAQAQDENETRRVRGKVVLKIDF